MPSKSRVYFSGELTDRYTGITAVLTQLAQREDLATLFYGRCVLVKPNCVSATRQAATTHRDAVRATLAFISHYEPHEIILGEGSAAATMDAFRNFGYLEAAEEYGARVMDLNRDSSEEFPIYTATGHMIRVQVAKTALESIRVSVALPKTYDTVIVTASLKNMVMGSILKPDKIKMHQGYPAINLNIALLGKVLRPHLGVIDGFTGMEGDGPIDGKEVPHRIALASTDPVALDAVTAELMGFSPREIGYLVHAAKIGVGVLDQSRIKIIGNQALDSLRRNYMPHRSYKRQLAWRLENTPLAAVLEQALPVNHRRPSGSSS